MINTTQTTIINLIDCKINILREILLCTAMADGILTGDEINILSSIDQNLDLLCHTVLCAYKDNIIDEYEIREFERIIRQIENQAISTAKFDNCISFDDRRLIKTLQGSLVQFQKILLK